MCGFIAQLVEHRTGIVEVRSSNPVEALIFSGFFFRLNRKIYCDDHFHFHLLGCVVLELASLRDKKNSKPRPQDGISIALGGSFQTC